MKSKDKAKKNIVDKALENGKEEDLNVLKINEDYAKRFEHNKKREYLEKATKKFGEKALFNHINDDEDSEDDESEDSNAELINPKVMEKFISTMVMLQDEKASKELLNNKDSLFIEDDFEKKENEKKENKESKVTIKEMMLKTEDDDENNILSLNYKPKIKVDTEMNALKNELLEAVKKDKNLENMGDDDFLVKKLKTEDDYIENNEKVDQKDVEEMTLDEIITKKKHKNLKLKDNEMLSKFWNGDKKLDKNERFLRNYILSEAWLDKSNNVMVPKEVDEEDSEKDSKFDEFEAKYNFRFEEEGGINVTTYKRDLEETYRKKDEKRIEKRKKIEERKKTEEEKIQRELKMARTIKKEEIMQKVDQLEKIAGTDKINIIINEMEKEYDPKNFDQIMNQIFDEKYYKELDHEENVKQVIEEKCFDYKTEVDLEQAEEIEKKIEEEEIAEGFQKENNNEDNYNYEGLDNEENQWWYCDECRKAIKENKIFYECTVCEDINICRDCFKSTGHPHKMKKSKVPFGCKPPDDWQEILDNMGFRCKECRKEIEEEDYFKCNECEGFNICKSCRQSVNHEHKLIKTKQVYQIDENNEINKDPKEKLKKLLDNYENQKIDKVIAKDIPTRFHYTKVEAEDYGISDEMLLLLDDRKLNQFVPLKKLAPYNDKFTIQRNIQKRKIKELERELERKKKKLSNLYDESKQIQDNNYKLLNKKIKRKMDSNTKKELRNKRRLESYGISNENNN